MREIRKRDGKLDEWAVLDYSQIKLKKELNAATEEILTDEQKKHLEEEEKIDKDKKRKSDEFKRVDEKYIELREMFTDEQKEKLIEIWVTSIKGKLYQEVLKKKNKVKKKDGKNDEYKELKHIVWDLQKELDTATQKILTEDQKQRLVEYINQKIRNQKKKKRK